MKWLIAVAAVMGLGVYLGQRALDGETVEDDMPDQTPDLLDSLAVDLNPMTYLPPAIPQSVADRNARAFLDMIAYAEGTGSNADGYRMMFGGGLFDSYADHPRRVFTFTNRVGKTLRTTAAGRYQFLARTWDYLAAQLNLPDFGPFYQDAAALQLIRERGALNDVRAGRLTTAITKCAPVWASLPGAGYNQPERKLSNLVAAYTAAGGNFEA